MSKWDTIKHKFQYGLIWFATLTGNTSCIPAQPSNPDNSTQKNKTELFTSPTQQNLTDIPNQGEMITNIQPSVKDASQDQQKFLNTIWEICWDRESAHEANPIGAISKNKLYSGLIQSNYFNATNQLHFGLLLGGKYKEFALKFYNTNRPGFDEALQAFETAYKEKGINAFIISSPERKKLLSYIIGDDTATQTKNGTINETLNEMIKKEGMGEDKEVFKDLQTTASNTIFINYPGILENIIKGCKKANIDPMYISPAIWGMWLEHIVATGNSVIIPKTLALASQKGGLEYINSEQYIDDFAVFKYTNDKGKTYKAVCSNKALIKKFLKAHNSLRTPENPAGHTPLTHADIYAMLHPQETFEYLVALNADTNSTQPQTEIKRPSLEETRARLSQSQQIEPPANVSLNYPLNTNPSTIGYFVKNQGR